jgi:hypothetical protein
LTIIYKNNRKKGISQGGNRETWITRENGNEKTWDAVIPEKPGHFQGKSRDTSHIFHKKNMGSVPAFPLEVSRLFPWKCPGFPTFLIPAA